MSKENLKAVFQNEDLRRSAERKIAAAQAVQKASPENAKAKSVKLKNGTGGRASIVSTQIKEKKRKEQ